MLIQSLQWLALAAGSNCFAAPPPTIPESGSQPLSSEHLLMLRTSDRRLHPQQALGDIPCEGFQQPAPLKNKSTKRSWLMLNPPVKADPAAQSAGWGLYLRTTAFSEFCLHWPLSSGSWRSHCLGSAGSMAEAEDYVSQNSRSFLVPEQLDPDRPILISSQSPLFSHPPLLLGSTEALLSERGRANLFVGTAYGILMALVVYGLLLLGSTRNLSLFFFSAYFALFSSALFLAEGLHVTWLGIGSLISGAHLAYVLLGVAFIAGTLFLGLFLRSRETDRWVHALLWISGTVAPALMFLAAIRLDWALPASEAGALIFALGGLAAACRGVIHGRRNAGPLLMGFVVLMLALTLNSLVRFGWLPSLGLSSIDMLKSALLLGGVSLGLAAEREFSNLRQQRDRASLLAETHQRIALYRVEFDAPTGLPSWRRFFKLASERVANAAENQSLGAIRIELTDFRKQRHLYGREVGEDLLRAIVGRLQQFESSGRLLARTETDEFSLLLSLPGRPQEAEAAMDKMATAIRDSLSEPFHIHGDTLRVRHAMGGSIFPALANSSEQLLQQAEAGVFEAREADDNALHLYGRGDSPVLMERWSMGKRLAAALQNNDITVHYQPIVSLSDGRIRQVEALARWTDAELGEVSPSVFIPIAETLGMIDELGRQIIHQACRDAADWDSQGILDRVRLSLNLSPLQLRDDSFGTWFLDTIAEYGLDGSQLTLEVTENTLVENLAAASERLQRLVDRGVGISVDDFGVGYSSLSYIRTLPIDTLKIDRSFMTRLDQSEAEREIVRSLLHMARKLGLSVVTEGIEHEAQLGFLRRHFCDMGQGFLLGRPAAAEETTHRLRRQNPMPRARSESR